MQTQADNFNIGDIKPVECMKEGWEIIKSEYWLFFGITIVGILVAGAIPIILVGPMLCGIYFCFLKKHDGGKVEFSDIAKGFDFFVPSLISILILIGFFFVVALIFVAFPIMVAMFALMAGGKNQDPENGLIFMIISIIAIFIFGVFAACAHALILFTQLLIVDRKLSGFEAIKLSAKASWQNLNGIIGFILVQMGLGILSYLLCIIGVYFFLPIAYAGTTVLYRKIFPPLQPLQNFNAPPAPTVYPGAGYSQ